MARNRCDSIADLLRFGLGDAALAQAFSHTGRPDRGSLIVAEQLCAPGHAEDDARSRSRFVEVCAPVDVVEHSLGHDQREQLGGVRGRQDRGTRRTPSDRTPIGEESAALE